ncbi:MAG: hypothetical protein DWQ40_00365 [Actinobacteria bacterium]|nr:MAG: hypothetical protein DWQ40_00365 [Actinomycetota bacterium]REK35577.1 MAG: hypothetical protein DWQ20_06020 [Actinomycetota bacterium]
MASTTQKRGWYPETISNFTSPFNCDFSICELVAFPSTLLGGPTIKLRVHPATVEPFEALAQVMEYHGVSIDSWAAGTTNCRTIGGSSLSSLHAHAIAIDILPDTFTDEFAEDVEAIRCNDEAFPAFKWLGPDFDRMHFEIDRPQSSLAKGIDWTTVVGSSEESLMLPVTPSSNKAVIATMQRRLNRAYGAGLNPDGIWGPNTQEAVELIPGAVSGDQSIGGNEWHNLLEAVIDAKWVDIEARLGDLEDFEAEIRDL